MSNGGESGALRCGGWSDPRPPTREDQSVLNKVKSQYEVQTKTKPRKFQAVLVRTQIVAGLNYLFKVFTDEGTYSHLRVLEPLLCTKDGPTLMSFQLNRTAVENLEYEDEHKHQKSS